MKDNKDCFDLMHKIAELNIPKISNIEEQYSYYNPIGQSIYNFAVEINNEIVSIHDIALYNVFNDIDYYSIVGDSPMWIRDAGHSGESCMSKDLFERLVKLNNNRLTNKFLYYHDLEALINSVQNRFSIITGMVDKLYQYLSPELPYKISEYDDVITARDISAHAILNTIIINVLSCCDILTKLSFEIANVKDINYDNYPKVYSKDILYSKCKKLPDALRKENSLFSHPLPMVIRQFESLRNEIVHNGTLDFDYTVYYGNKGDHVFKWIFFPEFSDNGALSTYNARRKFYPNASKTFNTILPLMIEDFLKKALYTLSIIRHTYRTDYYQSSEDKQKFTLEILNWRKTFIDVYANVKDTKKN